MGMVQKCCAFGAIVALSLSGAYGGIQAVDSLGPHPGDVFKEYVWSCGVQGNPGCNCGELFRLGYQNTAQNPLDPVTVASDVDITDATKAEVIVEISECHTGTRDLQLSVNGGAWIDAPIPVDGFYDKQHYYYPVIPVPLDQVKSGENKLSLKVNESIGSPWPQSLYSGMHLRVYYDPDKKEHVDGEITSPAAGTVLEDATDIVCEPGSGSVAKVQFLGNFEGVNWEGDGDYDQWHYWYYQGTFRGNIGTDESGPDYTFDWDIEWIPDQPDGMELAARIVADDGTIFMTPAVKVAICRPDMCVEICKMTQCPDDWVTRNGTKSSNFDFEGDPSKIIAAKLYTRTWGDASQPVSINGTGLGNLPGGGYHTSFDSISIDAGTAKSAFKNGDNTITVNGGGHHGEEVMYPGPIPVVQYSATNDCPSTRVRTARRVARENSTFRMTTSGDEVSFRVLSDRSCDFSLVRLDGGVVGSMSVPKGGAYTVNTSRLAGGIYLVRVKDGTSQTTHRVVIGR
jgi:hypothetical protein